MDTTTPLASIGVDKDVRPRLKQQCGELDLISHKDDSEHPRRSQKLFSRIR